MVWLMIYCCGRWGVLHSEKFWKENAKFMENDNFALVKALIALLNNSDLVSRMLWLCVYCDFLYVML